MIESAYAPEVDGWYALKKPIIWQERTGDSHKRAGMRRSGASAHVRGDESAPA